MWWQARRRITFLGLALLARPSAVRAQATAYAFVNVAVIPMDSNRVLHDQTVIVRGGRVVALGPAARVVVPAGAARIDGRGKFLIPGLADMHAHLQSTDTTGMEDLYLYAANGVTMIRIMGFSGENVLTLRARAAEGELVSPQIYAGRGPVEEPYEAGEAKWAGYDFIKVYGAPEMGDVANAAHKLGLPIAGHPPGGPTGITDAIKLGYASIEHLFGFDEYLGSPGWSVGNPPNTITSEEVEQTVERFRQAMADTARLRALADTLRRAHVWVCPTSAMQEADALGALVWPEMKYITPARRQRWQQRQDQYDHYARMGGAAVTQALLEARATAVRVLHSAGTGLLLGTDSPVPFMLPGFAVHRELQALVRSGLTPYDALATGTRNVAAYLGTLDSTGTVAVGKRADLVLLAGNPLEDIHHTMQPAGVMLAAGGGHWLDRAELDRGLAVFEGKVDGPW